MEGDQHEAALTSSSVSPASYKGHCYSEHSKHLSSYTCPPEDRSCLRINLHMNLSDHRLVCVRERYCTHVNMLRSSKYQQTFFSEVRIIRLKAASDMQNDFSIHRDDLRFIPVSVNINIFMR